MAVCVSLFTLFLYCFYGKIATESFENMADCLFEANWEILPIQLQKYVVIMIGNAQRPLYYHGFNIAFLNLETFTKVSVRNRCSKYIRINFIHISYFQILRTVYTYYMIFKTITTE